MTFQPRKQISFAKIQYHSESEEKTMKTVTYTIPNISCMHCVHTIKTEVSEVEGVKSVDANAQTKQATFVFDAPATEEKIVQVLKEINYPPSNN
jgi:copper chaperone CopZ